MKTKQKLISFFLVVGAVAIYGGSYVFGASNTAPSADFFEKSWSTMGNVKQLKIDCSYSAGEVKIDPSATADQKTSIALVAAALKLTKLKDSTIIDKTGEKMYVFNDALNPVKLLDTYVPGQTSNDEILAQIKAYPKTSVQFVISKQGIYFSLGNSKNGPWKTFMHKELNDSLLESTKKPLTTSFTKKSFALSKSTDKEVVYTGKLIAGDTKTLISRVSSSSFAENQEAASVTLTINAKDGLWQKFTAVANVKIGKIAFPAQQTCSVSYGKDAAVAIPTSAQTLDATTGATEFIDLLKKLL